MKLACVEGFEEYDVTFFLAHGIRTVQELKVFLSYGTGSRFHNNEDVAKYLGILPQTVVHFRKSCKNVHGNRKHKNRRGNPYSVA